jgi:hypothetical protein
MTPGLRVRLREAVVLIGLGLARDRWSAGAEFTVLGVFRGNVVVRTAYGDTFAVPPRLLEACR